MTAQVPQTQRVDARLNRERILVAARAAFASDGLDVPMRELAARAGVSPATLYRHFPSKQELAVAAYEEEVRACRTVVDDAVAEPDAWLGFRRVVEQICDLHVANAGFTSAFLGAYPTLVDVRADRVSSLRSLAGLVDRAKATGRLRPDFELADLVLVLNAHRGVRSGGSPAAHVAASRRFATLAIQAFESAPGPAAGQAGPSTASA